MKYYLLFKGRYHAVKLLDDRYNMLSASKACFVFTNGNIVYEELYLWSLPIGWDQSNIATN